MKESAEAMQPIGEVFGRIFQALSNGWDLAAVAPLLALALDFATWKKLCREQGMASSAIVDLWVDLIQCRQAG